ncbi:conjugal transfer protein TrbF [Caulobacter flavus]|uniref:Conjugal transfer protein TrbF n=1 Tax=Caulobacter flavus TaxID=1679497 RepID=A0A2N5CPA1_9CAUL|nr:conjugal transfer protein TrbF [Caulobacter flavus]AYV48519.1 conjugal transfer protein TrbF [Caulobacter flavus]PLR08766.1 conjugal transfer protein TrbF [Caulobacter flavus]
MNPFKGAPRYARTPPPETPYQRAAQAWDDRIGSARVQAANWRLMALGLLGLSGGLAGALAWLAAQGTVTPWVVQVDRLGQVQAVGPATKGYTPTDFEIRSSLGRFIKDVRSVSSDGVVVGKAWDRAYAYVVGDAANFITQYAATSDLKAQIGRSPVDVDIVSVLRESPKSFRATWTERRYADGKLQATERWTALLTVEIHKPTTDQEVLANGLGLKITAINWSREYVQ